MPASEQRLMELRDELGRLTARFRLHAADRRANKGTIAVARMTRQTLEVALHDLDEWMDWG